MQCPGCHKETTWTDNPWRPFCSERCQLVDLGHWVSGDYRIPLAEDPESITQYNVQVHESEFDDQQ